MRYLVGLVVAFLVVIAANVIMVRLALDLDRSDAVETSYEATPR